MKKSNIFTKAAGLAIIAASTALASCGSTKQAAIEQKVEEKPISIISSEECSHVYHKDLDYNVANDTSLYVCDYCGSSYLDFHFDIENDEIDEIETIPEYLGKILPEARFAFSLPQGTALNLGEQTITFDKAVVNYSCENQNLLLAAHLKYTIEIDEEEPESHVLKALIRGSNAKVSYDEYSFNGALSKLLEDKLDEDNPILKLVSSSDQILVTAKEVHKTINNVNDVVDVFNENKEIITSLANAIAKRFEDNIDADFDVLNEFFNEPVNNEDGSTTYTLKEHYLSAFLEAVGDMTIDEVIDFYLNETVTVQEILDFAKELPSKKIGEIVDMVVTYASTTDNPEESYNALMNIIKAASKVDIESELEVNENTLLSEIMGEANVSGYNDLIDTIDELTKKESEDYTGQIRVIDIANALYDGAYDSAIEMAADLEGIISLEFTVKEENIESLNLAVTGTPYGDFTYVIANGLTSIELKSGEGEEEQTITKIVYDSENVIKELKANLPNVTFNYTNDNEGEELTYSQTEGGEEIIKLAMDSENINLAINKYYPTSDEYNTEYCFTAKYSHEGTIFDFLNNFSFSDITEANFKEYVATHKGKYKKDYLSSGYEVDLNGHEFNGYAPIIDATYRDNKLIINQNTISTYSEEIYTKTDPVYGHAIFVKGTYVEKERLDGQLIVEFNEQKISSISLNTYYGCTSYSKAFAVDEEEAEYDKKTINYYSIMPEIATSINLETLEFYAAVYDDYYSSDCTDVELCITNTKNGTDYVLDGIVGSYTFEMKYAMSFEQDNSFVTFDQFIIRDNDELDLLIKNNENTLDCYCDINYVNDYNFLVSYDKTENTLGFYQKTGESYSAITKLGFTKDENGNFAIKYTDKYFVYDQERYSAYNDIYNNPETTIELSGSNDKENNTYTVNLSYDGYTFSKNDHFFEEAKAQSFTCVYDYSISKATVYVSDVLIGEFALTEDEGSFVLNLRSHYLAQYLGQEYIVVNYIKDGNVIRMSSQLAYVLFNIEFDTTSDDSFVSISVNDPSSEDPQDVRFDFIVGQDKAIIRGLDQMVSFIPSEMEVDWSSKSIMVSIDPFINGGIVFNFDSKEPVLSDDMFEEDNSSNSD